MSEEHQEPPPVERQLVESFLASLKRCLGMPASWRASTRAS